MWSDSGSHEIDKEFQKSMVDLQIIAGVSQYQKLTTNWGLGVDLNGRYTQWLVRSLFQEKRKENIKYLYDVYKHAFMVGDHLIRLRRSMVPNSVYFKSSLFENEQNISRLIKALKDSQTGLDNLKVTYGSDPTTLATLQSIAGTVFVNIEKFRIEVAEIQGEPVSES